MKKTVIAILFLLFTINLYAQDNAAPYYGFRLGLTASPNFGFIKAENGKGNGVSLGFSYGLIGDFNFAENYSFSTGLTITTINGKSTEVGASLSSFAPDGVLSTAAYHHKYMMQYIEIPLTIKLKTAHIGGVRWFGQFGLSNDIRIGAKQNLDGSGIDAVSNGDATDFTRFYRAGMIIGGGGEFDLSGKTSLMLGLTLNNGFTNISTSENSIRNHYIGLNVGVFF